MKIFELLILIPLIIFICSISALNYAYKKRQILYNKSLDWYKNLSDKTKIAILDAIVECHSSYAIEIYEILHNDKNN